MNIGRASRWVVLFCFSFLGCAHFPQALFSPKEAQFKILKVNSNKKYLHLMTRTRGVLGTSNWGKFNYEVVPLPYDKQGEYFSIAWKRSHGAKELGYPVTLRIEFKHKEGKVSQIEKVYATPKKGRYRLTLENTGDTFVDQGDIELWRVSLIANGRVVAEKESALWWTVSKFKS